MQSRLLLRCRKKQFEHIFKILCIVFFNLFSFGLLIPILVAVRRPRIDQLTVIFSYFFEIVPIQMHISISRLLYLFSSFIGAPNNVVGE